MNDARIREVRASNIGELVDAAIGAPLHLGTAPVWFRGQRNSEWDLEPGVWRRARAEGFASPGQYERNLVHRFRNRAGLYGPRLNFDERANWLQLMQHHRLPTRLLDWSRSPIVAAYFAVEDALLAGGDEPRAESDAAIWVLAPHSLNHIATRGEYPVTPSIESGICAGLIDGAFWGDFHSGKGRAWRSSDPDAQPNRERSPRSRASCLALMANETSLRMLMQQGAFTVHALESGPLNRDESFASCLLKIVIPRKDVATFAVQVRACGFDETGTYPDLDHLASELARSGAQVGP